MDSPFVLSLPNGNRLVCFLTSILEKRVSSFWHEISPLVREHLAIQFSTAMKTLLHDNIFQIFDFLITCSRAVYDLRIIVIIYIWKSSYYQIYGIICLCFVRSLISLFWWSYQSLTKPYFAWCKQRCMCTKTSHNLFSEPVSKVDLVDLLWKLVYQVQVVRMSWKARY